MNCFRGFLSVICGFESCLLIFLSCSFSYFFHKSFTWMLFCLLWTFHHCYTIHFFINSLNFCICYLGLLVVLKLKLRVFRLSFLWLCSAGWDLCYLSSYAKQFYMRRFLMKGFVLVTISLLRSIYGFADDLSSPENLASHH